MAEELKFNVKTNIDDATKKVEGFSKELKEAKDTQGELNKEAKESIGNFQIMGVSINSLKTAFKSAAGQAKFLFGSIKAGIISTGIGALLVAFGSLLTFLTKTKKGAELLERVFTGIGAAVSVIVDRVSKFGGAIVKLFRGDTKGALQDVKATFTGIGDEIQREVKLAVELKKQLQALRDSDRELRVETAQRRAEIEQLKLVAEDVTKSEQERLEAAQKAFDIENDLLNKRLANAEEAVRLQQEQMSMSENLEEDLDKLADLEVALADIRAESTTKQIELNNKINAIEKEAEARRQVEHQAELDRIKKEKEEREKAAQEALDAQIAAADAWFNKVTQLLQKEQAIIKATEDFKQKTIAQGFGAAAELAGEHEALSKAVAVAQTIYSTQQGIMAALAATSVGDKLIPYPLRLANAIATGVMGAAAVSKILSTSSSSAAGSGGVSGGATPSTPSPEIVTGRFELGGGLEPEPARAYVVSDDITNSQNKLANIRRRATI